MARVPYNAGDKGGSTDIRNTDNLAAALNDPDFDSIEIDDVEITATAAEINNACDVSARIVTIADATNTLALTAGFRGMLNAFDSDDESTLTSWPAAPGGGDDTITFNGVATGGKIYDHFSFLDIATDVWLVSGQITQSGGSEVTPFSSAA